jgi:signal peptidase I
VSKRRKGTLNFGRRKKKINIAIVKEVAVWTVEILLAVMLAFTFVYFAGLRTSVVGQSMSGTLEGGDEILVNRFIYTVLIEGGILYVNGEKYEEEIDVDRMDDAGVASEEITLGADEYFVLGDNRNNSEDSRFANIGNIRKDYIIGKAWFIISPFRSIGFI